MTGPAIDDLTFEDLRRIAIEELPGASRGEWTMHGAVDPGITILELLAWQLEQRLFMAEQLTEPVVRASLLLLGVGAPAPSRPATTVLSLRPANGASRVPIGTVLALADDAAGREVALATGVWALPITAVHSSGAPVASGDVLELTLEGDGPAPAPGAQLSLLVEVAAAPGVAAAWRPGAQRVRPAARLRWQAIGRDGSERHVQVADTTIAFRRSGLLRVAWPDVWDRAGSEPRRLRATLVDASFTEPVRILGVHPNAAIAVHRLRRTADLSDAVKDLLPLPDRRVAVPGAAGTLWDAPGATRLTVTERSGERTTWCGVQSWTGAGPADRVFVVDRARGELHFGDGRRGRILRPAGDPDALLRFSVGGGRAGNAGFGRWVGAALEATNPVPLDDGADPETLESARQRAADALARRDRLVTAADARELATSTPGLGLERAHVSPGLHPGFPCDPVPGALAVTIVPYADRGDEPETWTPAPMPDAGALESTRERLEAARLIGQEVFVLPPVYRSVRVEATVSATAQTEAAEQRMAAALRRHLDPLKGGPDGDGWPFGGPVRPSALAGVLQQAAGHEITVVRLAAALDDGTPSECGDLAIGPRELVRFGGLAIAWETSVPAGGGIR